MFDAEQYLWELGKAKCSDTCKGHYLSANLAKIPIAIEILKRGEDAMQIHERDENGHVIETDHLCGKKPLYTRSPRMLIRSSGQDGQKSIPPREASVPTCHTLHQ